MCDVVHVKVGIFHVSVSFSCPSTWRARLCQYYTQMRWWWGWNQGLFQHLSFLKLFFVHRYRVKKQTCERKCFTFRVHCVLPGTEKHKQRKPLHHLILLAICFVSCINLVLIWWFLKLYSSVNLLLCLIDRCAHDLLVSSTVITVKRHNFTRFT